MHGCVPCWLANGRMLMECGVLSNPRVWGVAVQSTVDAKAAPLFLLPSNTAAKEAAPVYASLFPLWGGDEHTAAHHIPHPHHLPCFPPAPHAPKKTCHQRPPDPTTATAGGTQPRRRAPSSSSRQQTQCVGRQQRRGQQTLEEGRNLRRLGLLGFGCGVGCVCFRFRRAR